MYTRQRELNIYPAKASAIGLGKAFGTFGELLQGRLEENETDFLVTLPIACYTYATFIGSSGDEEMTVFPTYKRKSLRLAELILDFYDLPRGGHLLLESDLPVGKGLASSSADMVATARAIASYYGIAIPNKHLQLFLHDIEPTDGVMYPGIVSFHHRQVELRAFLGTLPEMTIVAIDEGGELDTIKFNSLPKPFTTAEKREYQNLLDAVAAAVQQQDLAMIGQIATRSTMLNQKLNPKRTLNELIAICKNVDGLGIIVAHSGTCAGILLATETPYYPQQLQSACYQLSQRVAEPLIYRSIDFSKGEN